MIAVLGRIIARDLLLYLRRQSDWSVPLIFFVMIVSVFPIALAADPAVLEPLAPAIIWVATVLSLLMSMDTVFRLDHHEGITDQFVLSVHPLPVLLFGKACAHFLAMGLPLLLLVPLMAHMLPMQGEAVWVLWASLALGIPTISLVGMIGALLTIGLHRGGILLSILIFPLILPIIIFGVGSVALVGQGMESYSSLLILLALFLLALAFTPLVAASALKVSLE